MGNNCTTTSSPRSTLNKSVVIEFQGEMPRFRGKINFEKQSFYNKIERAARQFCLTNSIDSGFVPIVARLLAYNHHHYFAAFKTIPQELREKFTENIANLQVELMDSLYTHLIVQQGRELNPHQTIPNATRFSPPPRIKYNQITSQQLRECQNQGLELLAKRKIAVMLMLASGEEMETHTSKALEVMTSEEGPMTRLEILLAKLYTNLERVRLTESKQALSEPIRQPIIIACNTANQSWVIKYFQEKRYFGFDKRFVKIAPIRSLPVLNEFGKLCLSFQCKTLIYPEGSAKCLELLLDQGTRLQGFLKYHKVEYIHVLDCEDELECPADPIFFGIASRLDRRIVAKCASPNQLYEGGRRYACSDTRMHLLDMKELSYLNDLNLLRGAPIALNSMVFQVNWLMGLVDDYEIQLALSRRYHPKEIYCNYYDFVANKPVISAKCYIFQKDIRDYICASQKAQLIQYPHRPKEAQK